MGNLSDTYVLGAWHGDWVADCLTVYVTYIAIVGVKLNGPQPFAKALSL